MQIFLMFHPFIVSQHLTGFCSLGFNVFLWRRCSTRNGNRPSGKLSRIASICVSTDSNEMLSVHSSVLLKILVINRKIFCLNLGMYDLELADLYFSLLSLLNRLPQKWSRVLKRECFES